MVALPLAAEAFEEDCRRAALVVSQRSAPPSCGATLIDRAVWPRTGATALYRVGKGWETVVAFPPGYDRPWARALPARADGETPSSPARPPPRDATPRVEDLAPED
jgi:competence protein ComEC